MRILGMLAALSLLGGCVRSYRDAPTLEFRDIPYESVDGKPWPVKTVALPAVNAAYGLPPDTRVAYVELNPQRRPTLIFVHGLGSYLKFWRYQLDHFAEAGYRVLALDLPGYGKSDKPASFPYTTEAMADVVRAFARTVGAERPILVGHSMGGQVALSYAIRFPGELSALVLTAPAGFEYFSRREKAWFHRVFTVGLVKGTTEEGIWGSIRQNNFHRWRPEFEWLIEERVRLAAARDFEPYAYAVVKSVHGLAHDDFVREHLDKVAVPTLIIHGDSDRLIPNPFLHGGTTREIMAYGHERIPQSTLVTLERCGHMVQMDCARAYNVEVRKFLVGLAGR